MKGSAAIFTLAAVVLILGASTLCAQNVYTMPLEKKVVAGYATILYDECIFTIWTEDGCMVYFKKLDSTHITITVKPLKTEHFYIAIAAQLANGELPPLEIGSLSGGDTITIDTETGYAEK